MDPNPWRALGALSISGTRDLVFSLPSLIDCSFHSFIHSFIHSFTQSFTQSHLYLCSILSSSVSLSYSMHVLTDLKLEKEQGHLSPLYEYSSIRPMRTVRIVRTILCLEYN